MRELPNFLPGPLDLRRGNCRDYAALQPFHYLPRRPATFAAIGAIDYLGPGQPARAIAVGVLSYPVPACGARDRHFGTTGLSRRDKIVWANQHLRTISRVIVHPQFRSLGLSTILVEWLSEQCPTRYIEAMAKMGNAHPFFERAGFLRMEPVDPEGPVYFLKNRETQAVRAAA